MLRIRSSLLNKAHSGEVCLINTVSVYHAKSEVYMTPKSTRVSARKCSFTHNVPFADTSFCLRYAYFNKPCDLKIGTYQGTTALYVADCGNNRVQIFSLSGSYLGELGTPQINPLENYNEAKSAGAMLLPYGVTFAANGNVIVSDTSHKCMRMYNSNGNLLETWGTMSSSAGNFFSPMGCDINKNTGRLYVTDGVLQRLQYYDLISQ